MSDAMNRRDFLASTAALAALPAVAVAAQSRSVDPPAAPATPPPPGGPFTLPPLPYPPEALEPVIDAETMRIHHGKHHQAYVTNLNKAVQGLTVNPDVDAFIADFATLPADRQTAARNNGGGHANHSMFWQMLAPKGSGGEPSKELVRAVERDLGGMTSLQEAMQKAGASRFGSGWAWLLLTPGGTLAVTSTPNQDSPLMSAATLERDAVRGIPVLGIDVWEHAYYLKYQYRRPDYLKAIWEVVNWNEVSRRFERAHA